MTTQAEEQKAPSPAAFLLYFGETDDDDTNVELAPKN